MRHLVYLGKNEEKTPAQVVKAVPDPEKTRLQCKPVATVVVAAKVSAYRWKGAVPPRRAALG